MGKVEQVSKQILSYLLHDFQARELGADALDQEYVGVAMNELKQKCFEHDNTSTAVDFELALKGLDEKKLIGTGPMEVYDNPPGSSVVVLAIYSKREYVYLTAKGYRAAR